MAEGIQMETENREETEELSKLSRQLSRIYCTEGNDRGCGAHFIQKGMLAEMYREEGGRAGRKGRNEYTSVSKRSETGRGRLCCASLDATLLKLAPRKHLTACDEWCVSRRFEVQPGMRLSMERLVFLDLFSLRSLVAQSLYS
jgi:hypothetical protein